MQIAIVISIINIIIVFILYIALPVALIVLIILAIRTLVRNLKSHKQTMQLTPKTDADPTADHNHSFEDSDKKPLGDILKELRVKNHMTQEFIAENLGISRQAVSKWENGSTSPTMANLSALARLYHIRIEEIIKDAEL